MTTTHKCPQPGPAVRFPCVLRLYQAEADTEAGEVTASQSAKGSSVGLQRPARSCPRVGLGLAMQGWPRCLAVMVPFSVGDLS